MKIVDRNNQPLNEKMRDFLILSLDATIAALKHDHHKALSLFGKSILALKPFIGIDKCYTIMRSSLMLGAVDQFLRLHRPRQALHYSYELLEMLDPWLNLAENTLILQSLHNRINASCYKRLKYLQKASKYYNIAKNQSGISDLKRKQRSSYDRLAPNLDVFQINYTGMRLQAIRILSSSIKQKQIKLIIIT